MIDRQFLSHTDNTKELYYEYDQDEETVASIPSSGNNIFTPPPSDQYFTMPAAGAINIALPDKRPASAVLTAEVNASVVVAMITDIPLSATDIIIALTAQKLRKAFDQVAMQISIRDLSRGEQFRLRADLQLLKGL